MRTSLVLLPCPLLALVGAQSVMQTHIYIDTLSAYSTLGPCVKSRMSAIVRAQASGCADNMQLTSFACFCLTSSTQFESMISTDIVSECMMPTMATTTNANALRKARRTVSGVRATPIPVSNALEAFGSYCAMSTELARFQQQPLTVTLTESSGSASSAQGRGRRSRKKSDGAIIAATVLSSMLLFLAIIGTVFWLLRRRRKRLASAAASKHNRKDRKTSEMDNDTAVTEKDAIGPQKWEMLGDQQQRLELERTEVRPKSVYEMEGPQAELAAGEFEMQVRRGPGNGKEGWI